MRCVRSTHAPQRLHHYDRALPVVVMRLGHALLSHQVVLGCCFVQGRIEEAWAETQACACVTAIAAPNNNVTPAIRVAMVSSMDFESCMHRCCLRPTHTPQLSHHHNSVAPAEGVGKVIVLKQGQSEGVARMKPSPYIATLQ
eukprot:scaffold271201_cov21-Tisochrysis_lutea.AAC.1